MGFLKIGLIVAVVVLILLSIGAFFYFRKMKTPPAPPQPQPSAPNPRTITERFREQLNAPLDDELIAELFNEDYANDSIRKGDEFIV